MHTRQLSPFVLSACLWSCTGMPGVDALDGGPTEPDENATWSVRAPVSIGARQETAVVMLRGEIVVIGGFDAGAAVVSDVVAYDPNTDTWRSLAPLPAALHHANAAVFDDKIFVLGFLRTISFTADGRGFVYDPDLDQWAQIAPLPVGTERGGGIAVARETDILVIGGVRGGAAVDEVSRYLPSTDTWASFAALPAPRDHLVGGLVNGIVVVAGGREGRIASHAPTTYVLDVDDTWVTRSPMPTSRGGMAGAVWKSRLYVIGGEGNPDDETGVFDDVEAYDVVSDTWATITPMVRPRHGMGAAAADGVIYVPGGADIAGLAATAVHEALVVE
jgi:N-acetylneuraminic acid mutarotase